VIEAVLFDLDGTLIDTIDLIADSFDYAINKVLGKKLPRETLIANIGRPLIEQMRLFSEVKSEELLEVYNEHNLARHDAAVKPYPEVDELLSALRASHVPMAVVTSKKKALARRGLSLCGLESYMDAVVAVEDTVTHKPEPEPVVLALRLLGVAPERALFIGDSPYDILAGNRADVATVAAFWGPFSRESLLAEKPTYVAETPLVVLTLTSLFGRIL